MLKFGRYFALVVVLAVAVAGCGKSESEKQAEASNSGEGTVTCSGNALSGETGLPAGFPELDGVTFVKASDSGPTRVVDGYSDESTRAWPTEWAKERFAEEQYTVLFSELEKDRGDSEVSYKSKDGATTGIVALRASCDNGNVSVHVTARPAD
jgi:hypothetical protein